MLFHDNNTDKMSKLTPKQRTGSIFSQVRFEEPINVHPQNKSDSSIIISASHNRLLAAPNSKRGTPNSALSRSHSVTSLSLTPKPGFDDQRAAQKEKKCTPKNVNNDKSTITHFCTPRRSKELNRSMPKHLSISNNGNSLPGTPLKRFHSDMNLLPLATPDYYTKVQIDTPGNKTVTEDLLGEESSNLTVGVRVRPLSLKEVNDPAVTNIVTIDENEVKVTCENGTSHSFMYDHCFSSCDPENPLFANQDAVFTTMVQPLVETAFKGYNACLFAYGQTGSGKSYSMMGTDIDTGSCVGKEAGIIPRFCFELFERIDALNDLRENVTETSAEGNCSATVEISYFEIYNEKIHDLLGVSTEAGKRAPLKVREHPVLGPYVVALSNHTVSSYEDLQGWLALGNRQRATAATGMNEKSSRSHSIFSIVLTRTQRGEEHSCRSKINLVDLAGSERLSQTCASGDRLREGVSINRSLLTLGKVIASLSENTNNRKRGFVPYRDSVLTWLLRESLGGNSRTTMLATISPSSTHLDETLATLRYACQARTIVNRVRVNENPRDRVIRELREEIERLRSIREDYERRKGAESRRVVLHEAVEVPPKKQEIDVLKERLKQSEDNLVKAQKSWSERLEEARVRKSDEMKYLRKCGVALQLDWDEKLPCLVNLAADPMFSGTLLYLLPPGIVRIGRPSSGEGDYQPDIALNGPLVYQQHCTIENVDGQLFLRPGHKGETFVNGQSVTYKVSLHHGDRLVVGGNHYFRVSNPRDCVDEARPADYDYARTEINKVQEDRLQHELDLAKQKAIEELEVARREAEHRLEQQRTNYEEKIKQLGSTLTHEKDALADAQRSAEEMEEQICRLKSEVMGQKMRFMSERDDATDINISPYKSNFLKEVEDILNETTGCVTSVLKSPTSPEASTPGGVSLYDMQMMVQEASRLCKDLGVNYVFAQQQVVGGSSLEPMVRVRDNDSCRATLWTPRRFMTWLHRLRHFDPAQDCVKELLDSDESWDDDEPGDEGELNNARISVDTRSIKRQLNDSINQLSMSALNDSVNQMSMSTLNDSVFSHHESDVVNNTVDSSTMQFTQDELNCYVEDLEEAVDKLQSLCLHKNELATEALDLIEEQIEELRAALRLGNCADHSTVNMSSLGSSYCSTGNSSISVHHQPDLTAVPTKSNLRSPFVCRSPKAVRFVLNGNKSATDSD